MLLQTSVLYVRKFRVHDEANALPAMRYALMLHWPESSVFLLVVEKQVSMGKQIHPPINQLSC